MKILHIADLHLGKRVNDFSMIENQSDCLDQICQIVEDEKVELLIIAGDIYDKNIPSHEALMLFDRFVFRLVSLGCRLFVIAGNHDSGTRLAHQSRLLKDKGVYVEGQLQKDIRAIEIKDKDLDVAIYLLPFFKPSDVKQLYPESDPKNYHEAVAYVLEGMQVDQEKINILVTHHFITGSSFSGSELMTVGEATNVESNLFQEFDYVALGHIHRPQCISRQTIRYAGSPLKYSIDECEQEKSVCLVEILSKNQIEIRLIPLQAKYNMIRLNGLFEELIRKNFADKFNREDYFVIELEDKQSIHLALETLRLIYPKILSLQYKYLQIQQQEIEFVQQLSSMELIAHFYKQQFQEEMNQQDECIFESMLKELSDET